MTIRNNNYIIFQESEAKTGDEDEDNESLPSSQEATLQKFNDEAGTDTLAYAEETVEIQEPQLTIEIEEEILRPMLSDIAESELWEAHQWPDINTDDVVCPEDKTDEMLTSPVDAQTSESTVSHKHA